MGDYLPADSLASVRLGHKDTGNPRADILRGIIVRLHHGSHADDLAVHGGDKHRFPVRKDPSPDHLGDVVPGFDPRALFDVV